MNVSVYFWNTQWILLQWVVRSGLEDKRNFALARSLRYCTQLAVVTSLFLQVANCLQVSPEGCLEELFRKCPELEVVDLRHVKSVSDRTLLVLTEYCRHLRQLYVQGCTHVAMATLLKIHSERGVKIDIELLESSNNDATRTPGQI